VRGEPKFVLNTPEDPARTCAIANVGIEGIAPGDLAKRLFDEHKIFTVAINRPEAGVAGVRITPHLYTTTGELDSLVRALKTIAS
jgi:selenocysteine lyase/cysteine desulfurase